MAKLKGWIKLYRQITEHFLWQEKPYDKAHAWVDLIFLANTQRKKFINRFGKVVTIDRGECFVSLKFLANRWGWSKNKVVRYLGMLSDQQMCTVNGYADGTAIKLINFGKFQGQRYADEPAGVYTGGYADGYADGPQDKEYKNNKEYKEVEERACAREDGDGIYLDPEIWGESLRIMRGEE